MQVAPIKPTLKAPGTKRLKLKYDEALKNLAFNFNLRRYIKGTWLAPAAAAPPDGTGRDGGGAGAALALTLAAPADAAFGRLSDLFKPEDDMVGVLATMLAGSADGGGGSGAGGARWHRRKPPPHQMVPEYVRLPRAVVAAGQGLTLVQVAVQPEP